MERFEVTLLRRGQMALAKQHSYFSGAAVVEGENIFIDLYANSPRMARYDILRAVIFAGDSSCAPSDSRERPKERALKFEEGDGT